MSQSSNSIGIFGNITRAQIWRVLLLTGLALIIILSSVAAIRLRQPAFYAAPIALLLVFQIVYNYRPLYWLLIASIPLSVPLELGAVRVEIVSELLMLLFLLIYLLRWMAGKEVNPTRKIYVFHVLVLLILFWTAYTMFISDYFLRSFKFLLAKLWFVIPFVFLGENIIRDYKDIKTFFWSFFLPFLAVVIYVSILHAGESFSFESSHLIARPFFENGVIYGATLALSVPFIWFARSWYPRNDFRYILLIVGLLLVLLGVALSYKRGAWVATAILPFIALTVRFRLFDKLIYIGLIVAVLGISYLVKDNNFYRFAPNYQQTIFHHGDLEGHLEATFDGTELSSVERFYRWVAAKNMIADKPVQGFGPSTFNQVYQSYTDDAFRTYVSDNPEQSTTHNYFLMTFAEQGFVGGMLFLGLCIYMFLKAYHLYWKFSDSRYKTLCMMFLLSQATILLHSIMNEMIEVDKIGAFFWLNMMMIHKLETWYDEGKIN